LSNNESQVEEFGMTNIERRRISILSYERIYKTGDSTLTFLCSITVFAYSKEYLGNTIIEELHFDDARYLDE